MKILLAWAALAAVAAADVAVGVHGKTVTGDAILVDGDRLIVRKRDRERTYAAGDYCLVEKDDGTLVWAADFAHRVRAYRMLAREARLKRSVKLLRKALSAYDAKLARRLLDRAKRDGYAGTEADKLETKLDRLEERPKKPKGHMIVHAMSALDRMYGNLLLARAAQEKDERARLRLLRVALTEDPKHAGARAMLAAEAPKDFPVGARFWLDWRLDLEPRGATLAPAGDPELSLAQKRWRKDVFGILLGPIRLITPVRDIRAIRNCLAYADLTCKALAGLFKTERPEKRAATRLTVFLYGSREEYMNTPGTGARKADHEFLKDTRGYYSAGEQLSRVFWESSPHAERRVGQTFVHELTHHWLEEMNPRYSDSQLRSPGAVPGVWIREGFATFMEEGRYNVETGRWHLFAARARSLDVVATLSKSGKLRPWKDVYNMNYIRFMRIAHDKEVEYIRRWAAGKERCTPRRLFYDQAAATCQFLYHGEKGRYRAQLMDFVVNAYTGNKEMMPVPAAFGMTASELGKKVEAFALRVAAGWRPE